VACGAAALGVAGCGGSGSSGGARSTATHTRTISAAAQARLMATGAKVFAKHCASCHTIGDKVSRPTFVESPIPNFNEVKPKAPYVRTRVEGGGFDMPSIKSELSPAQFSAVVAYVASASGRDIEAGSEPNADVQLGEQVFRGNCQACHMIAGRPATGRPTYPGTDFDNVRPSAALVMRQVRRGIASEMPSFRHRLTDAQIRAVAAYVTATAGR
jgi:mono/diheme cytochrome c family protein